jgi:hypothetical protein
MSLRVGSRFASINLPNIFINLILLTLLAGCGDQSAIPGNTETIAPEQQLQDASPFVPSLTVTSTATPTSTRTITHTQTPEIILSKTPRRLGKCPAISPDLDFDLSAWDESARDVEGIVLDYLNRGGDPAKVIESFLPFGGQYFQKDLTNDGYPELIIGHRLLHIFGCEDAFFVTLLLQDKKEYHVPSSGMNFLGDMNRSGMPNLLVWVWEGAINSLIPKEYQILEWNGHEFENLIIQPDFESRKWGGGVSDGYAYMWGSWIFNGEMRDGVEVSDVDGDGVLELIMRGGIIGHPSWLSDGPWRAETMVYKWNGKGFIMDSLEVTPPEFQFQAIHDADQAFLNSNFDLALELYEDAIIPGKYRWWVEGLIQNENEFEEAKQLEWHTTPTPVLPDHREYDHLSAYARYRMLLIYTQQGRVTEAAEMANTMERAYPLGNAGYAIARLANVFWSSYKHNLDIHSACKSAVEVTKQSAWDIFMYVGQIEIGGKIIGTYHGGQTVRYQITDICPFLDPSNN